MKILTNKNLILLSFVFLSFFIKANKLDEIKLSLKFEKIEIFDLFDEISKKTDLNFIYNNKTIDVEEKVNVNFSNTSLTKILQTIFKGKSLDFKLDKDKILIFKKKAKSKKLVVGGQVLDETGETLPGVNIYIKGTTIGTVTDIDGHFELTCSMENVGNKLVFASIGMQNYEETIGPNKEMNVVLKEESVGLDEVVVVGYGTQKRASIIGSVDNIEVKQLKQPTRTLSTSLAGRLSGVIAIQNSGEPGSDGASFWIRGVNTFAGSSSPLVLVDGVERSMDDVDPEEIADFSILKDATATAVYGVRGANGVVLLTTKKGATGKPKVTVKVETGVSQPVQLPDFVDGVSYMRLQNEALKNNGKLPIYTEDFIQKTASGFDPYYYPNVDWMDELMQDWSQTQRANINVSGGGTSVRYFLSASFFQQDGMFKEKNLYSYDNNINVQRYNFRANVDADITSTTLLSIKLASILQDKDTPGKDAGGIFNDILTASPVSFATEFADPAKVPGEKGINNPYRSIFHSGYNTSYTTKYQSNIKLTQDLGFLVKGLKLAGIFSYDTYVYGSVERALNPRLYKIVPYGYDGEGNPILVQDGKYNYVDNDSDSESYHDYLSRNVGGSVTDKSKYYEITLNFNRAFDEHEIGMMFLFNRNEMIFPSESDFYDSVPKRYEGFAGRFSYAYDSRYFAEFNCGYNGSENFSSGNRYGFFPAFAIGWQISNEAFFSPLKKHVQNFKIKFSHGEVGNDRVGSIGTDESKVDRFAYLTRVNNTSTNVGFGTNNGYGYGSGAGVDVVYYGNENAQWEVATKTDLGIELTFLNAFTLNADLFYEKRTDIWTALNKVSDVYGYGDAVIGGNVGEVESKGFDGYIEYRDNITKDLSISCKTTFTYAVNEVLANGKAVPKYAYQSDIGHPVNSNYGYVAEGLFIDQAEIDNSPTQEALGAPKPGDIKYKDLNGDNKIDSYDQTFIGDPYVPEITYGIGLGINYKDFDFSALFQGAAKVDFTAAPKSFPEVDRGNVWQVVEDSRWTEQNQDINADFPRLSTGPQSNNYTNSTFWLQDGSYLRLKQVELGYTLPKDLFKYVSSVRLYCNAVNLFTISEFDWWDPETRDRDGLYYPQQRVINIGLNVKF